MNWNGKFVSQVVSTVFAMLAVVLMLTAGAQRAMGQACAGQNWSASTPNVWAAGEQHQGDAEQRRDDEPADHSYLHRRR